MEGNTLIKFIKKGGKEIHGCSFPEGVKINITEGYHNVNKCSCPQSQDYTYSSSLDRDS